MRRMVHNMVGGQYVDLLPCVYHHVPTVNQRLLLQLL